MSLVEILIVFFVFSFPLFFLFLSDRSLLRILVELILVCEVIFMILSF